MAGAGLSLRRLAPSFVVAALAGVLFFAPKLGVRWPCPFYTILRIPCPSCGLTRAARLAAHGDFAAATHMHPLWMVALPFVAALAGLELWHYTRTGAWGSATRIPHLSRISSAVVALLLIVWAARFLGAFGGPCPDP